MGFEAVFFDGWDTLFFVSASRTEQFLEAVKPFGLAWSAEAVEAALNEATRLCIPRHKDPATLEEEREIWQQFFTTCLQLLGAEPEPAIVERLVNEVFSFRWLQLFPETLSVLAALKGRYKLGLISNAWASMRRLMDVLGLTPYFDALVISAEVGVRKPDPQIFRLALEQLRVTAERAVFVDDDPVNVDAARQLGLHAVRIDRTNQTPRNPDCLRDLTELLAWL